MTNPSRTSRMQFLRNTGFGSTMPMVRVVEISRLRLVVPVPEAYTAEMKAGRQILFTVAAYPGRTWSGSIARIAQAVDVNTRTDGGGTGRRQQGGSAGARDLSS